MGLWMDLIRLAAGLNLLLLAGLGYVWGRNYVRLRSKHALALLVFAAFLFAENGLSLYMYQFDPYVSTWLADVETPPLLVRGMAGLHVFESLGLVFLARSAWD